MAATVVNSLDQNGPLPDIKICRPPCDIRKDDKTGSIASVILTGFAVLKKDRRKIVPARISSTDVNLTMMNGKITYE